MTSQDSNPSTAWPRLVWELPAQADEEQIGQLVQAAVDSGALGGEAVADGLAIYLPRSGDEGLSEQVRRAVAEEAAALGWAIRCQADSIADAPWATAWKDTFTTTPVGQRLLVRPDWEKGTPPPPQWVGRFPIWLRPGQAFGTGKHETTRLALELLERELRPGDRVLDFGAGSAVLSIAAVALGSGPATAVESDPEAMPNAHENLELNGCEAGVELVLADRPPANETYNLIICNMLPQHALPRMAELAGRLEESAGRLIYSGFLTDQKEEVAEAMRKAGLTPLSYLAYNEWASWTAQVAR